jgi:outer membrane protein assembly factor BamB
MDQMLGFGSYLKISILIFVSCIFLINNVTASDVGMFRADPQHTGVYDNGGINPDGILVWKFTTGGGVDSSPAVTNGVVYTGSNDKNVYALNAATGAKIWNYTTEGMIFSSPAVANGIVYIGSGEGNIHTQVYRGTVYALDAATGTEIWHYVTGGLVSSSPVVTDGVVYIGSADDNVYALNATTGTEIWHLYIKEMSSSPAVTNGVVYIGSGDGNIYAINATTGDEIWRFLTGYWITSSPAVANGVVYIGSYDHNVYALNATTGVEVWRYTTGKIVDSSPAVANGVVYIGSNDHNVYALNAITGAEIWRYTTGYYVGSSPAVANGVVYVGSFDNNIYALDAVTGTQIWHYSTGSLVMSSPAIANGMVYVGSNDRNVYAIGSSPDNTGSISFSSTPNGAQIYLDGSSTGNTTPYTLAGITPGQHAVTLKLNGYQDYNQNVTVIAGLTAIVHATLLPDGWISITAPAVISSPGHYRLTNDLFNSSIETAILITSSDVILDGNGHSLTGGVLENTFGVLVANEGRSPANISIYNLTTSKWEKGIYVQDSSNLKVFNCTSTENNEGISIIGIKGASIELCNLSLNTLDQHSYRGWGLNIVNSDGIEVKGNDIHSNKPFFNPYSSSGIVSTNSRVVIEGNHISDNDGAGILLGRSDTGEVAIRDNVIDNFEGTGISVDTNVDGVPVLIVNNTINAPEGIFGILSVNTNSVNLTSNEIVCKNRGITIVNSMNDTLSHNTIHGALTGFGVIGSGNITYYYHSVDETNTVDGKPIRYFKDIKGPFIDNSVDAATIIAINCTDGIITGQSLSKNNDGILFVGCRNMTVSNSVLNNNFYGIETYNTETCVFRDVVTSDNDFIGFASNDNSNIRLVNYTSNNNVAFGVILDDTEGFMMQDGVVNGNGGGISDGAGISASNSRGSITRVTVSGDELFGILAMSHSVISIDDSHILDTHGNGLQAENSECNVNNSEIAGSENTGVTVYNEGASVQMSGCTIRDSDHVGIWFSDAAGGTQSIISNTIFNNTLNALIEEVNDPITWNTSKTAGTNIVNGPFLGGNYWASPDGTGWSQVTPDRGDGFCNAPFVIDTNNTDYLPLHTYTPPPSDYNITLGVGWNMVSVPKKLAPGYDTGSIFKNVTTDGRTIWEYDGVIHNWVPVYEDTPVLPLYGFWIYSKYPTTVPLKFDPNPLQIPPTRKLVKGWELIGFTGIIPASARDTLISVRNNWTQAMGFDNAAYQYDIQIINGGSGPFSDGRLMNPTKGYWLFMTGPGDLAAIGV